MILCLYFAKTILRNAAIVAGIFLIVLLTSRGASFVPEATTQQGEQLSLAERLIILTAETLPLLQEFMLVILMVATMISLITFGRRAEIQVLKGAGLGNMGLIIGLMLFTALFVFALQLTIGPLIFELSLYAEALQDPQKWVLNTNTDPIQVAMFSANDGAFTGRLSNFETTTGIGGSGWLARMGEGDLSKSFAQIISATHENGTLEIRSVDLAGEPLDLRLILDAPLAYTSQGPSHTDLPLPYLLGWLRPELAAELTPPLKAYTINSAFALPFLGGALVCLISALCLDVGTRNSLGRLAFAGLSLIVLAYCLVIMSQAFGLQGKLNPILATWGPPALLTLVAALIIQIRHFPFAVFGRRRGHAL